MKRKSSEPKLIKKPISVRKLQEHKEEKIVVKTPEDAFSSPVVPFCSSDEEEDQSVEENKKTTIAEEKPNSFTDSFGSVDKSISFVDSPEIRNLITQDSFVSSNSGSFTDSLSEFPVSKQKYEGVPEDFLEQILKDSTKTVIWKKYLAEKFVLEHFNFYEAFNKFKSEDDEEKKQKIGDQLYEQFINPKGKTPIGLSHILVKKVKKLHDNGSDKGFSQVFQQVFSFFLLTKDNSNLNSNVC
jgi:hypothetical protein